MHASSLLSRRQLLASAGLLAGASLLAPRTARAAAPDSSVYQLDATLTDQDGRAFAFESLRGTPLLVSMFYTSCDMVCPMIFETVHATLRALPEAERASARVLMVSFDPARDSVAVLRKTADQRHCDARWTLARADDATTRKFAAVFNVQYRRISNGEFNHSSQVVLLDRQGRIAARSGKLGPADPAMVKAVHAAFAQAA